jgi:hypothetical protein
MGDFIDVDVPSDASVLAEDAVEQLEAQWPGWTANEGNLEFKQIQALSPLAQNAAEVAAVVPAAVFRGYGTKLIGEPYQAAVPATGSVQITAIDTDGYSTDDLVQLAQGDQAFLTDDVISIPPGSTSATVTMTSITPGAGGNDLVGDIDLVTALPWVSDAVIVGTTAGGVDAEVDEDYQDRLSQQLQLQAKTLVTGRDFELMALNQPNIGRAMAIVGTARAVTVAVASKTGGLVASADKTALVAIYTQYRQVNTTYTIIDPTFTTVSVTFTVKGYPSYDAADLKARCEAAIAAWLDPANFGNPSTLRQDGIGGNLWLNTTVIRLDKVLDILALVDGVDYVVRSSVLINGVNADLNLTGTAPLPTVGTITATVT